MMTGNLWRLLAAILILAVSGDLHAAVVHRYLFEDAAGTAVADSVGATQGTIVDAGGTGSWTTGRFGGAWDATVGGYVSLSSTDLAATRGSFVQWVKVAPSATDYSDTLTSHIIDPDYTPYPMRLEVYSSSMATFWGIPNGTTGYNSITSSVPVRNDTWHQWVLTFDQSSNAAVAYMDGRRVGSTTYNPTGAVLNPTWLIGARHEGGSGRCKAVYDNAAVYNHALSAAETWELYRIADDGVSLGSGPTPADGRRHYYGFDGPTAGPGVVRDLQSGYDGMVTGGLWTADNPPKNGGAWRKTAGGDEVLLPTVVDLAKGTYEGWFKSETTTGDWTNPLATAIRDSAEAHAADSMRIELTTTNTYIFDTPGAGNITANVDTTDGLWHLLSLTYENGAKVKLYVDGILRGQTGGNYDLARATDRGYDVLGARNQGAGGGWRGSVGTLAYFNRALSDAEILAHYQTGIPFPEPSALTLAALGLAALAYFARRNGTSRCSPNSNCTGPIRPEGIRASRDE
jgi:hypothetical protein